MAKIHVLGGGTFFHVRPHLALAAPAFGATARAIGAAIERHPRRGDDSVIVEVVIDYTEKTFDLGRQTR